MQPGAHKWQMLSVFVAQNHHGNLMFSLNRTTNTTICCRDFSARPKKLQMNIKTVMAGIVRHSLDVVMGAATLVAQAPRGLDHMAC